MAFGRATFGGTRYGQPIWGFIFGLSKTRVLLDSNVPAKRHITKRWTGAIDRAAKLAEIVEEQLDALKAQGFFEGLLKIISDDE